jgi:hypothetical protein
MFRGQLYPINTTSQFLLGRQMQQPDFMEPQSGMTPGTVGTPHGFGDLVAGPVDRVERKPGLLKNHRGGRIGLDPRIPWWQGI